MPKPDPMLDTLKAYLAENAASMTPEERKQIEDTIKFLDIPESERAVLVNVRNSILRTTWSGRTAASR